MTSPLDPRSWIAGLDAAKPGDRAWLGAWTDLTSWWVDPIVALQGASRPDQLLTQLIDGIAKQFEGQRIDLSVRGRRVLALLDVARLSRRGERSEVRLELNDLDVDGLPIERLRAVARAVRVDPGATTTIVASDIDVDGRSPLAAIVTWADERIADWSLSVPDGDRVMARHHDRDFVLHVEPAVRVGVLHLEVRSIRWRGLDARLPRWLRFERRVPFSIEPGWELTDATRSGDHILFRLHGDRVSQEVDLRRLRDGIVGSGNLTI